MRRVCVVPFTLIYALRLILFFWIIVNPFKICHSFAATALTKLLTPLMANRKKVATIPPFTLLNH
jgi:hypothetical protein